MFIIYSIIDHTADEFGVESLHGITDDRELANHISDKAQKDFPTRQILIKRINTNHYSRENLLN